MPNAISRETQAAIAACVHSVEELEVLLFLARDAARYCSAEVVCAETGLPARRAAVALEALASRNLLGVRIAEAVLYRLDPAPGATADCAARTIAAARSHRAAVLMMILKGRGLGRARAERRKGM